MRSRSETELLASFPPDLDYALRSESLTEFDLAMRAFIEQGIEYAAKDLEMATHDWSKWANDCLTPVTLVHGVNDQVAGIESIRRFSEDHADNVTLLEVPNGGFMALSSHTDLVLSALTEGVSENY